MRRLWHRLFGHPELFFKGWCQRDDRPQQFEGDFDGLSSLYSCPCGSWVEIEQLEQDGQNSFRHIRIVERGKLS